MALARVTVANKLTGGVLLESAEVDASHLVPNVKAQLRRLRPGAKVKLFYGDAAVDEHFLK